MRIFGEKLSQKSRQQISAIRGPMNWFQSSIIFITEITRSIFQLFLALHPHEHGRLS